MDEINIKLKEMRKKNGWTQAYMAQRLGITQPSYSQFENGDTSSMRLTTFNKLCKEFNLSADDLLGIKKADIVEVVKVATPQMRRKGTTRVLKANIETTGKKYNIKK